MKFLFILFILTSALFSAQKQLILGTFSNEQNAINVLKKLNEYVSQNEKLKSLYEKYSLRSMNTPVSGYRVISIAPFDSNDVIKELTEVLKSKYNGIYPIKYPTKGVQEETQKLVQKKIEEPKKTPKKLIELEEKLASNVKKNIKPPEQKVSKTVKVKKKKNLSKAKVLSTKELALLKNGVSYFNNKDYKNSYELFSSIYLEHLNDPKFNFAFGKSAYEVGEYQVALSAFERVSMLDPSNVQNRLEMARTYYMLNMFEDAQYAYEDVLANPNIDENIRKNIEFALAKVQRIQQKSFTYARVMADVIYDSNVNYGSIDDYEYRGATLQKSDALDDVALQAFVNLINVYDIGSKSGFVVRNSVSVYNKSYLEFDKYDLLYLSYSPSLLYKETKYTVEAAVGLDTLYLGGEEYLNSYSAVPSLQYRFTPTLSMLSHFKYQKKEFQNKALNVLDADRLEFSLGVQNILTPRSYIVANLLAIDESKVRGEALNVDFQEYRSNLAYINQFLPALTANLFAQVKFRDYDDYSVGFASTRKDVGVNTNLTINYTIFPFLVMRVRGSYEYINSNQDFFSFEKYVLSAGLVKTF